jgi:putative salt-induced outer membrane protein YdiY
MKQEIEKWAIWGIYCFLIVIMLLIGTFASAQTIVNDKSFSKTNQGISLVEFWAEWNQANECKWITKIDNAKSFRINLESETAKEYEISVLPTIIVFNNGEEIERYEGDLSFKLCPKRTPKKIKKIVDKLLSQKF